MVVDPITKICSVRPVVPGGAGGSMATPDFVTSVKPISTRGGGRLCPHITTGTLGFSDLPTALSVTPTRNMYLLYHLICEKKTHLEYLLYILISHFDVGLCDVIRSLHRKGVSHSSLQLALTQFCMLALVFDTKSGRRKV